MSSTRSRNAQTKRRAVISTSAPRGTVKSYQRGRERSRSTKIIEGSGNVFVDLGFSPEEATNLSLRSDLMTELEEHLKTLRLTQAEAAELLKVSQPRISDLMRGKIGRFSVDSLIAMLGRAGKTVTINVR